MHYTSYSKYKNDPAIMEAIEQGILDRKSRGEIARSLNMPLSTLSNLIDELAMAPDIRTRQYKVPEFGRWCFADQNVMDVKW